eukprot:gb/GFBE01042551.1/.p1 GENE.gb/GFBE01042551.1/~~gb/GFBE01042551.1/.p1  ORF type:complete len:615 (+),score=87.21 gb/GFBE01042551.1/:1-1845(+)
MAKRMCNIPAVTICVYSIAAWSLLDGKRRGMAAAQPTANYARDLSLMQRFQRVQRQAATTSEWHSGSRNETVAWTQDAMTVGPGMMRVLKAVFENKCSRPVYLYGYQDGQPTVLELAPQAVEEFTESRGFLPWREQRITLSFGSFFDGVLRPTNLDATVIELNADYESFVVPKSHLSFLGQLGYSNLNLEIAFWKDHIGGTLAADGGSNPACFSRTKTAFNVSECSFPDGSGHVLRRTWGELCMPVCPATGNASEEPCFNSCFTEPGVPVKYAEYISHQSLAWKQGEWVPSPATVDKHVREGGNQWSATFECWDFQTGPIGFPICDGPDPRELPDELGVWQVVACPDGPIHEKHEPPTSGCAELSSTCIADLDWAMQTGIFEHPEWYPSLSSTSSREDFQRFIHAELGSCPEPCATAEAFFEPVDGGTDRVCRGATPTDNSRTYYAVERVDSIDECKERCAESVGCKGIEYSSGRCEIWNRTGGIGASDNVTGFSCWRYVTSPASTTSPVEKNTSLPVETTTSVPDGGSRFRPLGVAADRVCRGKDRFDNSNTYFDVYSNTASLEDCKANCMNAEICKGIEFAASAGRCEVWTRPDGIEAVAELSGFECWVYDA